MDSHLDAPYVVAARFLEKCKNVKRVMIDDKFLISVVNRTLINPEPSMICEIVDDVVRDNQLEGKQEEVIVTYSMFPTQQGQVTVSQSQEVPMYMFTR